MGSIIQFQDITNNPVYPGVRDITPEELLKYKLEVELIDVRQNHEFIGELHHIPGAKLLTLDTLPQRLEELPKDKTIVFICRSGNRSGHAALFCQQHGFEHVYNLQGGMILWNEKALETKG